MGRCALMAAVLVSTGCVTAEEQRLEDACGGDRPALDGCELGLNWADCGGTETEPRFGCGDGGCRWFAGGCVASGFRASECPPGDLCCVEHDDGQLTPFAGGSDDWTEMRITNYVVGWGERAYDAERETALRAVDVVLGEPTVVESGQVECSEGSGRFADICRCEVVPRGVRVMRDDGFIVSVMPPCAAILFAWLHVNVRQMPDGSARAVVCHIGTTDVLGRTNLCREASEPVCAESGTLILQKLPETQAELDALAMEIAVTLDDGRTMELRF